MAECHHCKTAIRGESGLMCEGICKKIYHYAKKCSGIDQYSRGILESGGFVRFMCDDCVQYIHNMDMAIGEVQENVRKNKENLCEYKGEFKATLKQNENEIKKLLEAIEKGYNERLKKLDEAQKCCDRNVKEIKNLYGVINENQNKNKDIFNTIEEKNKIMCKELKKKQLKKQAPKQISCPFLTL